MIVDSLESSITEWRIAVLRGRAVAEDDADELESHLRDQVADLETAGLSRDEAFLIAVRRIGQVDKVTAEFAREHSDRLWKHLAMPSKVDERQSGLFLMLGFAILAGSLVQIPRIFIESDSSLGISFLRDGTFFVLPVLMAYFAIVKRMSWRRIAAVAAFVVVFAIAINVYPFTPNGSTLPLAVMHLWFVLWFLVGSTYLGGKVRSSANRMDFLRFSGEWAIYYALIALGGAVLIGLTSLIITPLNPEAPTVVFMWVVPSGAAGAMVVAAWLVEAKKSIIENLAPVLTAIFTPLFMIMLGVSVTVYAGSGVWRDFNRDLVTVFDALLLVVLALVVYGISARDAAKGPGVMDAVRLATVAAAIILDALVLISMFARIGEFGFTANRVAALGLNLILFVNLAVTVWLLARLLARRSPPLRLEHWQTGYLSVFAVWFAAVVLVLPLVFGFA